MSKALVGKLSTHENELNGLRDKVNNKHSNNSTGKRKNTYQKPDWFHEAPAEILTIKQFNGADWYWCAKCNSGQGQWSTSHCTAGRTLDCGKKISEHTGFKKPRSQSSGQSHSNSNTNRSNKKNSNKKVTIEALKAQIPSLPATLAQAIASHASAQATPPS
jgi:hypothetical protein